MSRIYSNVARDRQRLTPNALDITDRFMVQQMRWHYHCLRKHGADAGTARRAIWSMVWMASMPPYRATFVPYTELEQAS